MAKFCSQPTKCAVKHMLRYLKGTPDLGLLYSRGDQQECHGYSDSDWVGDLNDRKSMSGYISC